MTLCNKILTQHTESRISHVALWQTKLSSISSEFITPPLTLATVHTKAIQHAPRTLGRVVNTHKGCYKTKLEYFVYEMVAGVNLEGACS